MNSILSSVIVRPTADLLIILELCFVVSLFFFIPFLCISIGSLILSLWYGRCGAKDVPGSHEFAREILFKVLPDRHYGFIYGVIPLFTVLVVYAQTLYKADIHVVGFFLMAVFCSIVGFHFLYKYRWSIRFRYFLASIEGPLAESKSPVQNLHGDYAGTNGYTRVLSGGFALVFLLLAMYQFLGAMDTVLHPDQWATTKSSFYFLGSIPFWLRYSFLLSCCFAVTGAAILYFLLKDNNELSEDGYRVAKTCGANVGLYGTLCVPLFGLFYTWSLPASAYSESIFCYALYALILLFIASARLASAAQRSDRRSGSSMAFFLIVIALCFSSVGDNIARENATASHTQKILTQEGGSSTEH